jgi:hypothetical protein
MKDKLCKKKKEKALNVFKKKKKKHIEQIEAQINGKNFKMMIIKKSKEIDFKLQKKKKEKQQEFINFQIKCCVEKKSKESNIHLLNIMQVE